MTRPNAPAASAEGPDPDPRKALDAAIDAARLASPLIRDIRGQGRVFVPAGYSLQPFNDPYALPPHIVASVTLDDRASLVAYVNRFADPRRLIVADIDRTAIVARLDWHTGDGVPTPCAHVATLALRPSEEWRRWDAFEGKMHGQAEFAAFLEENAFDLVDPEPVVLIEISRDLEATQGVQFKSSTRLESGDRSFVYETETRTKGEVKVPREFAVSIPLFAGEEPVTLRAALRFKVSGGGLVLGFEWRRVEYQRQALFREIAAAVAEETGSIVVFGRTPS